ncbi:MAG: cytochrome C biogenesis protein [Gammaproteobacteria bacterium RIFCSPLOWO2_02_FULL_61_13]|nr:MAG: cytochrome C biogenesis protein [Gammaproteobacteria bacterium RIFCSPLOWO2_02_FULL_61_13]
MDPDTLRQTVESSLLAAAGIGLLAGLVFSFNPVAMAAIPVSLAYVTKARETRQAIRFGAMFIIGMILTHGLLGFIAGLGGRWVESLLGRGWGLLLGPLLILLGLIWPGWLRLPLPAFAIRAKRPSGIWGAFFLGIPFSVALCPVCTPTLIVLLGVSAGLASAWVGVVLFLAFAMGRAIPVAIGALALGWFENLRAFAIHRHAFDVAGGLLLIASGLYLLNAFFFWIPWLAG